MFLELC